MVATTSSTMQVPRFVGDSRIDYVDRPVPEIGDGELLIEVRANLLCGSERLLFQYGWEVTPGHEVAGEVAHAGPGTHTARGTRGVVFLMDFCGECRSCRAGATNQCLAKRGDIGFTVDSGYGPYVRVHETAFFPTGDVAGADATLLLDVMGTGGHAIKRAQLLRDDFESVLVVGPGPSGSPCWR